MPETQPPAIQYAGTPPGSQQGFLQALIGRTVYVRLWSDPTPLYGVLRASDVATLTLEVGTDATMPMLVYKHAIATIYPAWMGVLGEFLDAVAGERPTPPRQLAEQIADELFVNGFGERAVRLVLLDDAGRNLGGWSKTAVVDRITACLERGAL